MASIPQKDRAARNAWPPGVGVVGQVAGVDAEVERPILLPARDAAERRGELARPLGLLRRARIAAGLDGMQVVA
jgi:hypothetical protein